MHPPPINTGGGHAYAPQHQQQMYQQPAPPGYPMQQQQQHQPSGYGYPAPLPGPHPYNRLAEVEGSQRSRAQLIVGIDFVRCPRDTMWFRFFSPDKEYNLTWCRCFLGDHIFRCSIRVCHQHRSKRGYHRRMARRRYTDQAEGKVPPPTVSRIDQQ